MNERAVEVRRVRTSPRSLKATARAEINRGGEPGQAQGECRDRHQDAERRGRRRTARARPRRPGAALGRAQRSRRGSRCPGPVTTWSGTIRLLGTNTSLARPASDLFFIAFSMPTIDCAGVFFSSLSCAKISWPRRVSVYLRSESLVTILEGVQVVVEGAGPDPELCGELLPGHGPYAEELDYPHADGVVYDPHDLG